MTETTPEGTEYEVGEFVEAIPERVRTLAYFVTAIGAVLVAAVAGGVALWMPEYAERVMATGGLATTFLAGVAGTFGIIYRPTQYSV